MANQQTSTLSHLPGDAVLSRLAGATRAVRWILYAESVDASACATPAAYFRSLDLVPSRSFLARWMLCLAVWCALGGLMHEHSLRVKAAGVAELSMHTGDARTASAHAAGKLRGITLDALLVELFYPAGDETAKRQRG